MDITFLSGQFLISMPQFQPLHLVVLITAHNHNGATGLIVNRALSSVDIYQFLRGFHIPTIVEDLDIAVGYGGQEHTSQGSVLHSCDYFDPSATINFGDIGVTKNLRILNSIAQHNHPKKALVVLGCQKWSSGQLEQELQDSMWLVSQLQPDLIFSKCNVWQAAIRNMGLKANQVCLTSGNV